MHILHTTSFRDPDSFKERVVAEVSTRHLFETDEDGIPHIIEPPVVNFDYLLNELQKVGEVPTLEMYFNPKSYLNVVRGWIVLPEVPEHEQMRYYFYIEYQELYKSMVDGAVSAAKYSLRGGTYGSV